MARSINAVPQYLDDAGDPLVAGKVYFYDSGSSNPKTTYSDSALTTANTNPVILTASGRLPSVFFDGTAKVVLKDSLGVQIWERDPVGTTLTGAFTDWDATTTFAYNAMAQGSDDNFYISLTSSNQGNDPTSSPVNWSQIKFVGVYNANETYDINDVVQDGGIIYRSLANTNLGNATTDKTKWGTAVKLLDIVIEGSIEEETYTLTGTDIDPANGTIQTKTMAANTTFTSSITEGESIALHLIGGDSYTATWPTTTWIGNAAPTLTAKNVIELWMTGSVLFGAHVGSYV